MSHMLVLITHLICNILNNSCFNCSHFQSSFFVSWARRWDSFAKFLTQQRVMFTTLRKNLTSIWSLKAFHFKIFLIWDFRMLTKSFILWVTFKVLISLTNSLSFLNDSCNRAHSTREKKCWLRKSYCFLKLLKSSKKLFM